MRVGGRPAGGERPTGRPIPPPVEAFFFFFLFALGLTAPLRSVVFLLCVFFFFYRHWQRNVGVGGVSACTREESMLHVLALASSSADGVRRCFFGGGAHGHDGVGAATNHSGAEPAWGKNQTGTEGRWVTSGARDQRDRGRVRHERSQTGAEQDTRGTAADPAGTHSQQVGEMTGQKL